MKPKASIILTSYNYAQYLEACLRSVFSQTYKNVELIIMDDASSDDSVAVIKRMCRESPFPWKCIANKTNVGQAACWNTAFAHCTGEYISFIDSDDYWQPDKIAKMVMLMTRYRDGAIYQHMLENGKRMAMSGDIFAEWLRRDTILLPRDQQLISPCVPSSGIMITRDILQKVFPVPETLRTCPDGYVTRTALAYGKLYSLPDVLGTWRDHEENAGKQTDYNYERFWVKVLMPEINAFYKRQKIPLRLRHAPSQKTLLGALIREWARQQWGMIKTQHHYNQVIVFGGGVHTTWLEAITRDLNGPEVIAVLDDKPDPSKKYWGLCAIQPESCSVEPPACIVLSTDAFQRRFKERCHQTFGDTVTLIDLYKNLPRGPYFKEMPS